MINTQKIPPGSFLGINYSGMHDTAIALVSGDGEPVFAVSLERLSRTKQDGRFPGALLRALPWERIAKVAISTERSYAPPGEQSTGTLHPLLLPEPDSGDRAHGPEFLRALEDIPCDKIFVPHHLSHAASSFWGAGFDEALCLVYDGGMANESWFGGVYRASLAQGIAPVEQFSVLRHANITHLYSVVTAVLGFTPLKHEGKITGLAAYGRPSAACREVLERWLMRPDCARGLFGWDGMYGQIDAPALRLDLDLRENLKNEIARITREDAAATVQAMAEEHVLAILANIRQQGLAGKNICLSGGLFANVKINQRVSRSGFENIFIAPPMTDDGTALGAAWQAAHLNGLRPRRLTSMYLGPAANPSDSLHLVQKLGVKYTAPADPAGEIAARLASGKIVAVFAGACEFGPRALGNRSILAPATASDVNQTLNARLERTEFMPFAPIIRAEDAGEYFDIREGEKHACQFMTLTVDCTERAKRECPAVVHIDMTARPQLVSEESNPLIYRVLAEYRGLTGKMALVNTSFNIHEEPIVCSVEDALRGFFEAGLDCLYLEGVGLIELDDNTAIQAQYLRAKTGSLAGALRLSRDKVAELNQRTGALQHYKNMLEAKLAEQCGQTASLQRELSAAHDELSAAHDELSAAHDELSAAHEQAAALGARAKWLQDEWEAAAAKVALRERELREVYASKSWRLTLPLRKIMQAVKWARPRLR